MTVHGDGEAKAPRCEPTANPRSVHNEILPSSTLFRAGESLQVVAQGQDLFEHPSLAHDHSQDVNLGIHSIHAGAQYDSHLLIPVVR